MVVVNSAATVVVSPLFAVATHHKLHQPPLLLRIIVLSLPPSMSASSSFCSFTLTDDLEQQNDVVFENYGNMQKKKITTRNELISISQNLVTQSITTRLDALFGNGVTLINAVLETSRAVDRIFIAIARY